MIKFNLLNILFIQYLQVSLNIFQRYHRIPKPKPKPLEALESVVSNDVFHCSMITNVEKEETRNPLKEIKDKKAGRSSYCKYIKTIQTEIGRDAAKYGVANGVQKSKQRFPAIKQKGESDFMRKYLKLKNNDPSEPATEIQAKKRGYSVLIPDELMIKTVDITQTLRLKAAPISYLVIAAFARGGVL